MNDEPKPASDQPPPTPPPGETIPVARPSDSGRTAASGGSDEFGPRPIFEIEEDRCPKCGIVMPSAAVVCVKCGYDQRANVVREVSTGVVEVPASAPAAGAAPASPATGGKPDFVQPGRLSPRTLAIAGGVLTAAAVVCSCIFAPASHRAFMPMVGLGLWTLYLIAVNTATGVGAVAIAAKFNSQPLGRLDLTLARMFAAFSLYQAIANVRPSLGYSLFTNGVPFVAGAAAYFVGVMLLFKKDRQTATLIAAAHFLLWLLLQLGPVLAGWIAVAPRVSTPAA